MEKTFAFMAGGFGWGEILVIILVLLLLFGARKVPELSRSLGRSLSEFKKGREEGERDKEDTPSPGKKTAADETVKNVDTEGEKR